MPTELAGDEACRIGGVAYPVCPCAWWVPVKPKVVAMVEASLMYGQMGHPNSWAKVRSVKCSCTKAAVVRTGRVTDIPQNLSPSKHQDLPVCCIYGFPCVPCKIQPQPGDTQPTLACFSEAKAQSLRSRKGRPVLFHQRPTRRISITGHC